MKKFITCLLCLILSLTFLCFSGCGPRRPPLGKVEGSVHYDGELIRAGTIIFTVVGMRDASGLIENGVIKDVTTFAKGDGVPVGEAKIAVITFQESSQQTTAPPPVATGPGQSTVFEEKKIAIPIMYTNPETSGLTATIKKGSNTINLELAK